MSGNSCLQEGEDEGSVLEEFNVGASSSVIDREVDEVEGLGITTPCVGRPWWRTQQRHSMTGHSRRRERPPRKSARVACGALAAGYHVRKAGVR